MHADKGELDVLVRACFEQLEGTGTNSAGGRAAKVCNDVIELIRSLGKGSHSSRCNERDHRVSCGETARGPRRACAVVDVLRMFALRATPIFGT